MKRKLTNVLTLFLTMSVCSVWAQSANSDFYFTDIYGNNIKITNVDKLPSKLDTAFLKSNLTGLHFNKTLNEKALRYDYIISDITRTKNRYKFEIDVIIIPHTKEIEEILKYLGGRSHYRMTLKRINKLLRIDNVVLMYGEV